MSLWKGTRKERPDAPAADSAAGASLACEALVQFFKRVKQVQASPYILMLGELCGTNVSFLGERGFRVCMESDIRQKPQGAYAGALLWDSLSLMPRDESQRRAELLHALMADGGAVLAIFDHPATGPCAAPRRRYRIISEGLVTAEKVEDRSAIVHPYQNGDIVRLFEKFQLEMLQIRRNGRRDALLFKRWGDRGSPGTGAPSGGA